MSLMVFLNLPFLFSRLQTISRPFQNGLVRGAFNDVRIIISPIEWVNLSVIVFELLAGVQTPNCIRATAFDAAAHDYRSVTVLSDATAGETEAIHSGRILYFQFELRTATVTALFYSNAFLSPSRQLYSSSN